MHATKDFYKAPRYLFRKLNILRIIKKLDAKTFLDVGCGAGELACSLAENGMKGVAVDFSEDAIAVAKNLRTRRGIDAKQLSFKLGGLENVKGKKFDLVSCYEVLEHIKDDEALLKELVAHSKKYVLISVPAKQKLFDSSDQAVGHFRRYEKQNLIKMLQSQDLEILDFINYGYPFTDAVRVGRKVFFKLKLKKDSGASMKNRSKGSGINPIKLPSKLTKLDLEKPITPLYHASRVFNKYNLSEGYLVLCQKKN